MAAQFFSDDVLPATLAPLAGWPVPDPAAQRLSCRLVRHICEAMARHAGALNFARFMDLALYAPGLGYYSAGLSKFGAAGDYVTAPEISPLFSRCVARCCSTVLSGLGGG